MIHFRKKWFYPANIRLDEDVFGHRLQKTYSRCLDQDEYIRLTHTSSEDVFKTSSRCLHQDQHIRLGHMSSRRLQDVFKTSSRHFQDVFKMFWKRLQDVLKTSSRRFQDVLSSWTVLGNTILRHLRDVFKTFLRRTAKTIIYKRFA